MIFEGEAAVAELAKLAREKDRSSSSFWDLYHQGFDYKDGRASLAVQQMSELMAVPGIDIVGALPAEIQDDLIFSGGVFAGTRDAANAAGFLAFISGPATAALYKAKGLFEI